MGNSFRCICLALLATSMVGCATIINGSSQTVEITSNPPGAKVSVLPEGLSATTPCELELHRKRVHTVLFELDGYRPATGYLDRTNSNVTAWNIVIGGAIGMAVDRSTGATYRLVPDPLHVDLVPAAPGEHAAADAP